MPYYNSAVHPVLYTTSLSLLLLLGVSALRPDQDAASNFSSTAETKHQGIAYEHASSRREASRGYGSDASADSLTKLKELGASWIAITPFGFQQTPHDTAIRWGGSRFVEINEGLRSVTRQAHDRDIRVMLKPHIWLRPPAWVGMVEPRTEDDWTTWFAAYREFILHYAALASDLGIEAMCIGNELKGTTHREEDWRGLIDEIRTTYDGILTYGAHTEEVWNVPFWDALDYIGVSAYFELSDKLSPTRSELIDAWAPITSKLERLSTQWNRPVLFTELGYRSVDFAAQYPWKFDETTSVNIQLQADLYAAFFEAVWLQPWFGGVYWWKWMSSLEDGGPSDDNYTPHGKQAAAVLQEFYTSQDSRDGQQ